MSRLLWFYVKSNDLCDTKSRGSTSCSWEHTVLWFLNSPYVMRELKGTPSSTSGSLDISCDVRIFLLFLVFSRAWIYFRIYWLIISVTSKLWKYKIRPDVVLTWMFCNYQRKLTELSVIENSANQIHVEVLVYRNHILYISDMYSR